MFYQVKIVILKLPSLFISLNQTQNKIQISYTKLNTISSKLDNNSLTLKGQIHDENLNKILDVQEKQIGFLYGS